MIMDLTSNILCGLKGYLGITVSHPKIDGELQVVGATVDAVEYGWTNMPDEMRVKDRKVYCCQSDRSTDMVFVFEDEVEVINAPAYLVVGALMDRIYEINPDSARLLEDDGDGEVDEDDEDWICEGAP